ncbi:hypothetical protein DXA02_10920 [Ruminococcus sp. AM54-1NS]|nr:hypothetical protein DXA02_10920 [Ruminococcus sp. AM54-1NS]
MRIKINEDYNVVVNTALLGYVGETNARPVSVEGLTVDGADRYVLTIDYGDGVQYEVDITGGTWTPTADILRSAQTVSCQICAKKLSGQEYILLKKSRIFRLRIGAAIGDTAIPSPSVAADALDKIDAIGRQAHADMQTAVTAADTATTAAENAEKSATAAEKSADTATQAASRAETAKTAAETSATQADTARQGAETARAEAVTSQNNAKISAAQAATSAQQTEADKTITAGYAKTAKTNADSTAADRQAVQTLAEQVTADKATVADHAAKVATDRTAAETAAQTAQAVADSLPDDYVTAVEKIAENTAEIGRVKLTDKELQRRVNALYDLGNGVTHQFETDTDKAYQKTVPTGGKLMSVKNIGGRSIVFNQMIPDSIIHVTITIDEDIAEEKWLKQIVADTSPIAQAIGHKVAGKCIRDINNPSSYVTVRFGNNNVNVSNGSERYATTENGIYTLSSGVGNPPPLYFRAFAGATAGTYKFTLQLFDLTAMFGAGNEPSTVEEFEKMFPADYYPYAAGEIVSAGVTEVAVGETTHPIPETIKALPGYGWSAGTARNYVNYENKKYYQCVGSVDLGTLDWKFNTSSGVGNHFYGSVKHFNFKYLGAFGTTVYNVLCSKYRTVSRSSNVFVDKTITIDGVDDIVSQVQIKDTAYTDATEFKQAMSGVILYYELANPIITDISTLIPDDFLRNLTVEAGGSITFKNSNGDSYRIPVPSEEEYIVKLSEVGGTT